MQMWVLGELQISALIYFRKTSNRLYTKILKTLLIPLIAQTTIICEEASVNHCILQGIILN